MGAKSTPDKIVDMGDRGTFDIRNKLNDLPSKDWIKFTKSWFVHYPPPRTDSGILHPAKFPEKLAKEFIEFFTKKGQTVLDPFLGTGSTLVACDECDRKGIGVELIEKYYNIAKARLGSKQKVIHGNSIKIDKLDIPKIDFVFTSPPYGPMLGKNIGEIQKLRREQGLDTKYSDDGSDLGNVADYGEFVDSLVQVFINIKLVLNKNCYLVVILQNYRDGSEYKTLAWDFGSKLNKHYTLKGEKIWCQDNKTLLPYSYRWSFVPNIHHHYCLIFQNDK